ncbi:MAG: cytochrome c-type biogenesis protein [Pseudomonadales bacterium]|jgi:cytochrome c-type biogenesis protein CcmH|nr:cytochrome c-type biogenesis protein [Pseudomonadales bacterium]
MMLRLLSLTVFLIALQAWAVSPVDVYSFDTPEQQQRYKGLIAEFRCPKCLNTNIAGSDAPIAQDLRRTVHRLVVQEGYSDQEVRDFLQARYGDFVLYNPPFNSRTMLIWLVPLGLAIVGALVLFGLLRRARQQEVVDLDESQRQRVRALLEE